MIEGPRGQEHVVKRSKFTDEHIAFALKQAELGVSVEEVCRKMGISDATFYVWRKKYGGIGPSELRRLRAVQGGTSVTSVRKWLHGGYTGLFGQSRNT